MQGKAMRDVPEALRLADALEQRFPVRSTHHYLDRDAANELRRLHAQRDALLEALKLSRAQWIHSVNSDHCLAAIAKCEENT